MTDDAEKYEPPTTAAEFLSRFQENTRIDGWGVEVAQHVACPFCAFPEFMVLHPAAGILPGDDRPSLHDEMRTPTECGGCGRSGAWFVEADGAGVVEAEFVQIGGDDPAEFLKPPPRRSEARDCASATEHPPHLWKWDGAPMFCGGRA